MALPDRNDDLTNDDLTEDRLLGGRVRLTQPATGYRAGIDPVLLAAAVPARAGERVLDVGAGTGAAALCLAARVAGASLSGIEADRALVRLATANADSIGVGERVQFFVGDLLAPPVRLAPASFDHVMANPPFLTGETSRVSPDPGKTQATVEDGAGLEDWLKFCLLMAAPTGTVTLIHRADRLDAILESMVGRLGGIVVFPLWPGGERKKAAKRVIVAGRRGSRAPLSLVPGLVLHRPGGAFTEEAEAVLRHAGTLQVHETGLTAP